MRKSRSIYKTTFLAVFAAATSLIVPLRAQTVDSLFWQATTLYLTDRPQQALETYLQLLEKDPDNAVAAYQAAQLLSENKQFSIAQIYIDKACSLQPENEWYQQLRAQLCKTARQFNVAADIYRFLQETHPENLDYSYEEANMYVLAGDLAGAAAVYDRLEKRYGLTDEWTMQKYKLYMGLGNDKAARAEIERIAKEMPAKVKYPQMLAQMCLKSKDYKAALAWLKKVEILAPEDPYLPISFADYYRTTGDSKRAFQSLLKAVNNPALDFRTKIDVLQTYYSEQEEKNPKADLVSEALTLFSALNKVHPDRQQGFFAHAKFLIFMNRYDRAVQLLEQAVRLDSGNYSVWRLMMYACHMDGENKKLIESAGAAALRFPEMPEPPMYLGLAYSLQNEFEQAIENALQSSSRNIMRDPFVAKVNLQVLGDAWFETGQAEKSLEAYEQLFALDPQDAYVRNNYAYYLALAGRELAKAEALAAQLCKEQPKNSTFLDTYGWVLYRLGQYKKATVFLKAALDNGKTNDATILEHYGDALYMCGDTEKARIWWRKALEKALENAASQDDIQNLKAKLEDPSRCRK